MSYSSAVAEAAKIVYSKLKPKEEIAATLEKLTQPFDPDDLKWLPQGTTGYRDERKAQAAVYADPRVYQDRLNEVLGPSGWFEISDIVTTPSFQKRVKTGYDKEKKETTYEILPTGMKVIASATVVIPGIGLHGNVSEEDGDDQNAVTAAYAKAFKRACSEFGLGRYFYDFPKSYYPLNEKGVFFEGEKGPQIPAWAYPKYFCEEESCKKQIVAQEIGGKTRSVPFILEVSRGKYGKEYCAHCLVKKKAEADKAATPQPVAA